jgi:hypothetical protein
MTGSPRLFATSIRRDLDLSRLRRLSAGEAEQADEEGHLEGNAHFRNLSGLTWRDVGAALQLEHALIERFLTAPDSAAAEQAYDDERCSEIDSLEELWGLDVGVASAVTSLSALGAVPIASCNAGSFGNQHAADHPFVAFLAGDGPPHPVLEIATAADVGLTATDNLGLLFSRSVLDLVRFAEIGLERS